MFINFLSLIFKMLHTEEELENILNNFKERILVKNCLECWENISFYTDGRVVCCNKINNIDIRLIRIHVFVIGKFQQLQY